MDKSKEGKNFINRNALLGGVFVFAIAPMLINIGLAITDSKIWMLQKLKQKKLEKQYKILKKKKRK